MINQIIAISGIVWKIPTAAEQPQMIGHNSMVVRFGPRSSESRPQDYKTFLCSAQLRLKFILLKNVKMPTTVGILTFMSRINYSLLCLFSIYLGYFGIYEQLKFYAQLSSA